MKGLILALMMVSGVASAGTITLEQTGPCLYAYYCLNAANDAGANIGDIVYSTQYGRLSAMIDGVPWDSGIGTVYEALGQPAITLTSIPLHNGLGGTIYVTVNFQGGQVTGPCHQSGRVCVFPHAPVYLTGGKIVTP
jgi:hypothetical protein